MSINFIKNILFTTSLLTLSSVSFAHSVEQKLSADDLNNPLIVGEIFRAIEKHDVNALDRILELVHWDDFIQLERPETELLPENTIELDSLDANAWSAYAISCLSAVAVLIITSKMMQFVYQVDQQIQPAPAVPLIFINQLQAVLPPINLNDIITGQAAPAA